MSANPSLSIQVPLPDLNTRWRGKAGDTIFKVTKTHSARDIRDGFLALAYLLSDEPPTTRAVCLVIDSRLSFNRVQEEVARFRAIVHPQIADRLDFLMRKKDRQGRAVFSGSMAEMPDRLLERIEGIVSQAQGAGHTPALAPRQIVMLTLAQLRLWNQPPITVKALLESCRVSYPTVAKVLKFLAEKGLLEESGERGVRLRLLSGAEWMELGRDHVTQRKTMLFTDPTGLMSPLKLASRLEKLVKDGSQLGSVRVGGVMGASRHFPALDVTAAPRLDLSVENDPMGVAAILDAALVPKTKPEQRTVLAVHLTRNVSDLGDPVPQPSISPAGELECLADLIELGFVQEASEMAAHMASSGKARS